MSTMREKAFGFIGNRREEMLSLWRTLVDTESGTFFKEDADQAAAFLKDALENYGARVRTVEFADAGNGLVAEFGSSSDKAPVCFLGHFDTVFPRGTVAERPFRIEDGRVYGPGVLDMKGGVVIQLFAARALAEAGCDRPIRIVLAGDEESMHARSDMARVFEEESRGAVVAFNFETGDVENTLVVGRKGTIACDIAVRGVSVHAGREPEKGRSAILEIAHKIVAIQGLTNCAKGITFNVGTVKGGVVNPSRVRVVVQRVVPVSPVPEVDVVAQAADKSVRVRRWGRRLQYDCRDCWSDSFCLRFVDGMSEASIT